MARPVSWFGESWGAPCCDPDEQVETPVGAGCAFCAEPIADGDRGFVGPGDALPSHLECTLRCVLGSVEHIEGRCSCYGGHDEDDPPGLSRRDAAILAVAAWERRHGTRLL
jgi:hypothetical protein